jgi:hypothetical protein
MNPYFVEGLFLSKKTLKKVNKTVEPYARVIWADSPTEAIRIATQDLAGGQWVEGPTVSNTTEEQRMRQAGAPELPGFKPLPRSPGKSAKTKAKRDANRNPKTGAKTGAKKKPKPRRGLLVLALHSVLAIWCAARPVKAGLNDLFLCTSLSS